MSLESRFAIIFDMGKTHALNIGTYNNQEQRVSKVFQIHDMFHYDS